MKKALITILLLIAGAAILLAGLSYYSSKTTEQRNENETNPPASQEPHTPSAEDLRLETPKSNDVVSSPLEIAGEVCCGTVRVGCALFVVCC